MKKLVLSIIRSSVRRYKITPTDIFDKKTLQTVEQSAKKTSSKQTEKNGPDIAQIEKVFVEKSNALANDLERITSQMVDFGEQVKETQLTIKDVREHSSENLTSSEKTLLQLKHLEEST